MKYLLTVVICCLTFVGQAQVWSQDDTTVLVCDAPISFNLDANPLGLQGRNFAWNTGAKTSSISLSTSGIYWVDVTYKNKTQRDSIAVRIVPPPRDLLQDTAYICTENSDDKTVVYSALHATRGEFIWNDTTYNYDAKFYPVEPGNYTLTAKNKCGTFTDEIVVLSDSCECSMYFPNTMAISCGDSYGDMYMPHFTCDESRYSDYHIQFYNRWGQLMWESFDINDGWDGFYQKTGEQVAHGVYYKLTTYSTTHKGKEVSRTHSSAVTFLR